MRQVDVNKILKDMKKIYLVVEHVQMFDGDMWAHWVEENILSYHASEHGAEVELAVKVDGGTNKGSYTEANNGGHGFQLDIYFVKEMNLLP